MYFKSKYPLTTREAVCTPLILFDGFSKNHDLPCPSLPGIRDFTDYCGVSYSALRTSLSRLHADGYIRIFKDDQNVTRYRMTESAMDMGQAMTERLKRPEGFILAIFSFTKKGGYRTGHRARHAALLRLQETGPKHLYQRPHRNRQPAQIHARAGAGKEPVSLPLPEYRLTPD